MSYPVYRFYANAEDAAHDRDGFHDSTPMSVRADAEGIAQRPLSYPSVWNHLRRTGRIFIQGRRSAGGQSFVIRRIDQ